MVGIIVTGHGTFGSGISSGVKLIAGEQEHYEFVDFLPEDSLDALSEKLEAAAEKLADSDSILILTDIAGGSPFNVSCKMKLAGQREIEVVGGVSLPVLLEVCMTRDADSTAAGLADAAMDASKEALVRFEQSEFTDDDYEE